MDEQPRNDWRSSAAAIVVFLVLFSTLVIGVYADFNCSVGAGDYDYWACHEGDTYWPDVVLVAAPVWLIGGLLVWLILRSSSKPTPGTDDPVTPD